MKKILCVILVMSMSCGMLAGCGKKEIEKNHEFSSDTNNKIEKFGCYFELPKSWTKEETIVDDRDQAKWINDNGEISFKRFNYYDNVYNLDEALGTLQKPYKDSEDNNKAKAVKNKYGENNMVIASKSLSYADIVFVVVDTQIDNGLIGFILEDKSESRIYEEDFVAIIESIVVENLKDNYNNYAIDNMAKYKMDNIEYSVPVDWEKSEEGNTTIFNYNDAEFQIIYDNSYVYLTVDNLNEQGKIYPQKKGEINFNAPGTVKPDGIATPCEKFDWKDDKNVGVGYCAAVNSENGCVVFLLTNKYDSRYRFDTLFQDILNNVSTGNAQSKDIIEPQQYTNIDLSKCIEDMKANLPLDMDYSFVKDYYIEVNEGEKLITFTAVVGDATDPQMALDFADTLVRQLNLYAQMQDNSIASSSQYYYGGLYETYSAMVGVAPASKTGDQSEWFVYDAIAKGGKTMLGVQKKYK